MRNCLSIGASYLGFAATHFLLLILSLTVIGLYGQDLNNARQYSDSKWVYAVVVSSLSAFSSLVFMIPHVLRFAVVWIWDVILFVLWIALFGVFGKMFIKAKPGGSTGIQRMRNAVWIDLINALLWLIMSVAAFAYWRTHRELHARFAGRTRV